eukprot:snap_masked-scaffold_1-processed-gene-19.40-mRNA-1 protein AED:0.18 eAED:0.23 QI:0/-1/0/1/-1/1/1/0/238
MKSRNYNKQEDAVFYYGSNAENPVKTNPQSKVVNSSGWGRFAEKERYIHNKLNSFVGESRTVQVTHNLKRSKPTTPSRSIAETEKLECGICLQTITSRFGLLPNCAHSFCLSCIRDWRKAKNADPSLENVKGCPICRKISNFIIPSNSYLNGQLKTDLMIRYKESLSHIRCKYFTKENNFSCPFNDSCLYLHMRINEHGKEEIETRGSVKLRNRTFRDWNGGLIVDRKATLGDFLGYR